MRALPLLLALASASVGAQTADTLTVYDALAMVADGHPLVRSAEALSDSREAATRGVTAWAVPTLGYAMEGIGVDGGFEQRVVAGVEVGPASLARAERARLGAEARAFAFDAEAQRWSLRARVVTAFVELGVADSLVAIAAEAVALADRLAEVARLREAGGEAAGLETLRAELEAEQARAMLSAAIARRESLRAATTGVLGLPTGNTVAVAPRLTLPEGGHVSGTSVPALAAAEARVDAAAFAGKAARAARLPVWSAEVFPQHVGGSSLGVGFQVGVRLPLGQRRIVAARVEAAEALRRSAEANREALSLAREASVHSAQVRVAASLVALDAARSGPAQRAEALLALALRGYQLGEVTQQVLLDARRAALDTRRAGLAALAEVLFAYADLERASGAPILFPTAP